jgi:hypothetical protein
VSLGKICGVETTDNTRWARTEVSIEPFGECANSIKNSAENTTVHVDAKSVKCTRSRSVKLCSFPNRLNCDVNQAERESYRVHGVSSFLPLTLILN